MQQEVFNTYSVKAPASDKKSPNPSCFASSLKNSVMSFTFILFTVSMDSPVKSQIQLLYFFLRFVEVSNHLCAQFNTPMMISFPSLPGILWIFKFSQFGFS